MVETAVCASLLLLSGRQWKTLLGLGEVIASTKYHNGVGRSVVFAASLILLNALNSVSAVIQRQLGLPFLQ